MNSDNQKTEVGEIIHREIGRFYGFLQSHERFAKLDSHKYVEESMEFFDSCLGLIARRRQGVMEVIDFPEKPNHSTHTPEEIEAFEASARPLFLIPISEIDETRIAVQKSLQQLFAEKGYNLEGIDFAA